MATKSRQIDSLQLSKWHYLVHNFQLRELRDFSKPVLNADILLRVMVRFYVSALRVLTDLPWYSDYRALSLVKTEKTSRAPEIVPGLLTEFLWWKRANTVLHLV